VFPCASIASGARCRKSCCCSLRPFIVPLALTSTQQVLEVVDGVSAVVVGKLAQEGVVVAIVIFLLDNDGLVAVSELVDDVLDLLAKLELLESGNTLSMETDTRTRHLEQAKVNGG